ncbi:MAG TPA: hypothetical protein ENI76_08340 [Ignavibacteria bacterium]|nr:hypothetical protein [Ignavibacteria bacterium]
MKHMNQEDETICKIRDIRNLPDPILKPSPYLRTKYVDEFGSKLPVRIRDYQARGIMNLLQVQDMILGDDTGLGKTLQVLSAIGYIWMKEPEYVPIVITKKSSLYQWQAEAERFMKGMEVITIDDGPFERNAVYEDFFLNHDPDKKKILIMTYEVMWKDMEESVVRDRTKPTDEKKKIELNKIRKILKSTRLIAKNAKTRFEEKKPIFKEYFDGRDYSIHAYIQDRLKPPEDGVAASEPSIWSNEDERMLSNIISLRDEVRSSKVLIEDLKDKVTPPKLIPGLFSYVKEMLSLNDNTKIFLIMDEVHYLKNHKGKMHESASRLASVSARKVGMTATPVKNRLMEFFSLFKIIQPSLFPKITYFQHSYCITKLQPIGGGRKIPIVVGHSKNQLKRFVEIIEPFYLSRRKHEVAEELPELITRELVCTLSNEQDDIYEMSELEALAADDDPDSNRSEILKAMTRIQQACDAPQLVLDEDGNKYQGVSSKMNILLEILQENTGTKTIIFSRFEKMISLIQNSLLDVGIKHVRITGKENKAKDREKSKIAFQDIESGINVILITTAGSESINLHAAEHLIFIDNPWSWGDYVQLIGRPIRIGNKHAAVLVTHLMARRQSGEKTIDDHVVKILRSKKSLADTVAGVSLKDGLKFTTSDMATHLIQELRQGKESSSDKLIKPRIRNQKQTVIKNIPSVKVTNIDLSDI